MSQAARERSGRWIAVLVASLTAHLIALLLLGVLPHTPAAWGSNAIDVAFSIEAPQPDLAPDLAPAEPAGPENISPAPVAAASRRRRPTAASERPAPAKPIAPSPKGSEVLYALDPTRAARSFLIAQEVMPGDPSASNQEGLPAVTSEPGAGDEPRNYFEGTGKKRYLSVRDPPKLRRHRDGTHHYQGHAFKAVVEPDGSVTFDDGYSQGVTVRFDITELMMRRRGEDPYRVEKNWFLGVPSGAIRTLASQANPCRPPQAPHPTPSYLRRRHPARSRKSRPHHRPIPRHGRRRSRRLCAHHDRGIRSGQDAGGGATKRRPMRLANFLGWSLLPVAY